MAHNTLKISLTLGIFAPSLGTREVKQQHGLELYHARNFNENFGHVALSFLSYLCLVVTRLLTPKLRDKTLGQVKQLVFDALVELEPGDNGLIIKFSSRFRREVGLGTRKNKLSHFARRGLPNPRPASPDLAIRREHLG